MFENDRKYTKKRPDGPFKRPVQMLLFLWFSGSPLFFGKFDVSDSYPTTTISFFSLCYVFPCQNVSQRRNNNRWNGYFIISRLTYPQLQIDLNCNNPQNHSQIILNGTLPKNILNVKKLMNYFSLVMVNLNKFLLAPLVPEMP